MLVHAIAHRGSTDTVRECALEVDSRKKQKQKTKTKNKNKTQLS